MTQEAERAELLELRTENVRLKATLCTMATSMKDLEALLSRATTRPTRRELEHWWALPGGSQR